jgi:glycosyltransferase involved in cell wall biosynthesis
MKRVLYITQKPHHPMQDGGTQAIASFLLLLSKCKDIELTYAPICTLKHPGDFSTIDDSIQLIPLRINPKITFQVLLKSIYSPMNVLRYTRTNIHSILQSEDSIKKFDVVICDGFYALAIIPGTWFTSKRVIYRSHNLEYNHWEQRATSGPWYSKFFFNRMSRQMYRLEQQLVSASSHVLSISYQETQKLSLWNAKTSTHYPMIRAKEKQSLSIPKKLSIGFVGSFEWFPNADAIRWFIQTIWPLILAEIPTVEFEIAGKGSEAFNMPSLNIHGLGFVQSLDEFYNRQTIIISPLRFGTGLNMKILEALSYGKPIVTTAKSIQGFEQTTPFVIANDPSTFAERVVYLLNNNQDIQSIELEISEYINSIFEENKLLSQLEQQIHG